MRGWLKIGGVVLVLLVVGGLILSAVQKARLEADREQCKYRFLQLGQFAAQYHEAVKPLKRGERLAPDAPLLQWVPPGTLPNPALKPDERLSWVAAMLPVLNQKGSDGTPLADRINPTLAWDAGTNKDVSTVRLTVLVCPGAVPDHREGEPAVTQFVGLSGVGPDSAELPLVPLSPRAGCFRYDSATPLQLIRENDGLSATALFAETAADLGPWLRGGFSTVRGLDVSAGAKPHLGPGGQFGGNYPNAAGFAFADGSARFFPLSVSPAVLRAHFTIAGNDGAGVE